MASSNSQQREAVFPTRQNLNLMTIKLRGAQVGYDLLKRKSEALTRRFREITQRIDDAKHKMGRVMQIASFSLTEVAFATGSLSTSSTLSNLPHMSSSSLHRNLPSSSNFGNNFMTGNAESSQQSGAGGTSYLSLQIQQSVSTATLRVNTRVENVSGVMLPMFDCCHVTGTGRTPIAENSTSNSTTTNTDINTSLTSGNDGNASRSNPHSSATNAFKLAGLSKGGQQLQRACETYTRAIEALVELASLQTAFVVLDQVLSKVNRRVNALEYIVIPRTQNSISYIRSELDELDREEFYRLKKLSNIKAAAAIKDNEAETNNVELDYQTCQSPLLLEELEHNDKQVDTMIMETPTLMGAPLNIKNYNDQSSQKVKTAKQRRSKRGRGKQLASGNAVIDSNATSEPASRTFDDDDNDVIF